MLPAIIGATVGGLVLILPIFGMVFLYYFDRATYKRILRCGKKPLRPLTIDRGPVEDQLRAILADRAYSKTPDDVFSDWDKDKEGSVSRKEFRLWWPRIGYDVPPDPLNNLFDEFDVDGSGEIDRDEFKNAFDKKGELWKELGEMQKKHDKDDDLQRLIDECRKKLERKEKQLKMEESAVSALRAAQEENNANLAQIDEEIAALNTELQVHQARLDAFKGSIKKTMQKATVVRAFQTNFSPDDAAAAIQARVRGKASQKLVAEMKRKGSPKSRPGSQGGNGSKPGSSGVREPAALNAWGESALNSSGWAGSAPASAPVVAPDTVPMLTAALAEAATAPAPAPASAMSKVFFKTGPPPVLPNQASQGSSEGGGTS